MGFLDGTVVKNLPTKAEDAGDVCSNSGVQASLEGNGNSLRNSCLEKFYGEGLAKATSTGMCRPEQLALN